MDRWLIALRNDGLLDGRRLHELLVACRDDATLRYG